MEKRIRLEDTDQSSRGDSENLCLAFTFAR